MTMKNIVKIQTLTRRPLHVRRLISSSSSSASTQPVPISAPKRIPIPIHISNRSHVSNASDTYHFNVKINELGRHGGVEEARKLFDEMPSRDIVAYSTMINVYLKSKDLPKAEALFRAMPERSIVAESAMVDGYVKAGRIGEARKVFDEMSQRNVYSWTSLISGYMRIGLIDEARALFDRMPVKNVVTWTTLFVGYARNGLISEARRVFDAMPERNVVAWTAIIRSYIENDLLDEAEKLFIGMPHKNLYSWNIMISGFLDAGRVDEAIRLFNIMPQKNAVTWTAMVTGLARNRMTAYAREFFFQMPKKDIAAWNAMITAYINDGLMVEAAELFNSMPGMNIVTWNAMIDGYTRNGPGGEALKLLILMLRSGIRPNDATFTSVLISCDSIFEIMQTHALVIQLGLQHDTLLSNALVTMYARNGDVLSARYAFESLDEKDVVSWTAMILAYSNHGFGHHALNVFGGMLKAGVKPDDITFVGVLSACSHAGLVKKGQNIFNSMSTVYALEPKAEHYSCLVDILGRAGLIKDALEVVSKMPHCEVDGAILGALLSACRLHGNENLANEIGLKLIELEPSTAGAYVLLANAHAASGRWSEAAQVRKKMKDNNVKKVPGFSQIEIKGENHVFFSGDRSHPEIDVIYELLQEMLVPLMLEMAKSKES